MTSAKRKELQKANRHGIVVKDIFSDTSIVFRDDVETWKKLSMEDRVQRFKMLFDARVEWSPSRPLTIDQIQTIRGILCPAIQIARIPATPDSWNIASGGDDDDDDDDGTDGGRLLPTTTTTTMETATILQSLDTPQEQLVKYIGTGHRILAGVAGSGKTQILLARARWLSQHNPDAKILLTCYNRALAGYLRSKMGSYSNVEVVHFHGWARKRVKLPTYTRNEEQNLIKDIEIGKLLLDYHNQHKDDRYDAILLDEAHIMIGEWVKSLVHALKDPENGNLFIACDRLQMVRHRPRFTWSSVDVKARGRTTLFSQNYRNTGPILKLAWNIVSYLLLDDMDGNTTGSPTHDETFPLVEPTASHRHGPKPKLLLLPPSKHHQGGLLLIQSLLEYVASLLQDGQRQPNDIAIIYRWNIGGFIALLKHHMEQRFGTGIVYWVNENGGTKDYLGPETKGIRLITHQSSLGLEFQHVIVIQLEQFDRDLFLHTTPTNDQTKEAACKELYVGVTRACQELTLVAQSDSRAARFFLQTMQAQDLDLDILRQTVYR
jgi:superfamily I DNA/RNA helicase